MNIVIIEQNKIYCESPRTALDQIPDFKVIFVKDNNGSLQEIKNIQVHLILLDYNFGKSRCNETIDKASSVWPVVKFLLLTTYKEECNFNNTKSEHSNLSLTTGWQVSINTKIINNMNLVLRCFSIEQDSIVKDVPENKFFVGINNPKIVEKKSGLFQNYPNPCMDFTIVEFDMLNRSSVILELFDMKGSHVATLINLELAAGGYEIN